MSCKEKYEFYMLLVLGGDKIVEEVMDYPVGFSLKNIDDWNLFVSDTREMTEEQFKDIKTRYFNSNLRIGFVL